MILLSSARDPDQLSVAADSELLNGWELIVEKINQGQDPSGKYIGFITTIENSGSCCGFKSVSDVKQNPSSVTCSSIAPCSEYVQQYAAQVIGEYYFSVYLGLCMAQLVLLFIQVLFIIKVKKLPDLETEHGWIYKTIHN